MSAYRFTVEEAHEVPGPVAAGIAGPAGQAPHRLTYTNSEFTFNTNVRPANYMALLNDLREAARNTFTNHNIRNWIIFVDNHGNPRADGSLDDIRSIRIRFVPEVGANLKYGGRCHIHGRIEIAHVTRLRLDWSAINTEFNQQLLARGCAYRIHYFRWTRGRLTHEQYTKKWDDGPGNPPPDDNRNPPPPPAPRDARGRPDPPGPPEPPPPGGRKLPSDDDPYVKRFTDTNFTNDEYLSSSDLSHRDAAFINQMPNVDMDIIHNFFSGSKLPTNVARDFSGDNFSTTAHHL